MANARSIRRWLLAGLASMTLGAVLTAAHARIVTKVAGDFDHRVASRSTRF